ncbi:MAG: pentapeptide repeat-containing protein [Candidatus Methanoperedens sp.]|nr:pentapeptide repeat-containing protein [Candidatus Methanoperedens sp.]
MSTFGMLKEIFSSPLNESFLIKRGNDTFIIKPNAILAGKNLSSLDISKANLRSANLHKANLNRANMRHANLQTAMTKQQKR